VPRPRKKRTRSPDYLSRPTIPIAYLQLLVEILSERGVDTEQLFAGIPVAPTLLEQPKMSALDWTRLTMRAVELTDAGLGYEYGLRMRPTAHGLIGYAAMSAGTVRDAIDIVVRYASARQAHFEIRLEHHGDHSDLVLAEKFPIPVMREFFYENILLGLARGSAVLLGRELEDAGDALLCFDFPQPRHYHVWRSRLPPMRFECPRCSLRFPSAYLDLRPALADSHASEQALALCERELGGQIAASGTTALVLRELGHATEREGYPSLSDLAERLALSPRTLKRRLKEEGTSFLELLNDRRQRDACDLLAKSDLPVRDVARRLGYENPANFTRAFSRASGVTPTAFRRTR
jgi:AraC-like DNA-binding protein